MLNSSYDSAAKKYKPATTRLLFIAEAPPLSLDRYFYFERVERGDSLWIALMKALYESDWRVTKEQRRRKPDWLRRFQNDHCLLIDAVKEPISGCQKQRIAQINRAAGDLLKEVESIRPKAIVLIKTTVHRALFQQFINNGLYVINSNPLPFPARHARKFADEFRKLMPEVNAALGQCDNLKFRFCPVEIRGDPLSATILRERR